MSASLVCWLLIIAIIGGWAFCKYADWKYPVGKPARNGWNVLESWFRAFRSGK